MVWEENSRICLHMQLIAILSRIGVFNAKIKAFRAALRGVTDIKFFLFRLTKLYA